MNTLFEMKFGSHLYGTSTPNSDLDLKGIYIPTAEQIKEGHWQRTITRSRGKKEGERNTKDDIDIEIFSLDRFMELLAEGQTVALDMIFAPDNMILSKGPDYELWNYIKANKDKVINKNVTAFVGYARKQAARYGVKGSRMEALDRVIKTLKGRAPYSKLIDHWDDITTLIAQNTANVSLEKEPLIWAEPKLQPNGVWLQQLRVNGKYYAVTQRIKDVVQQLEKKYTEYGERAKKAHLNGGKDYKALSHAVRVNNQGIELFNTGTITFPRPDAGLLLQIKNGFLAWEPLSEMIEQGLVDLVESSAKSSLRETPDQEWIDSFVKQVYDGVKL